MRDRDSDSTRHDSRDEKPRVDPSPMVARAEAAATDDANARATPAIHIAPVEPLALRARDAARLLGISERALWSLTKSGEVPCVKLGRTLAYPVEVMREWIRKRAKGGDRRPRSGSSAKPDSREG